MILTNELKKQMESASTLEEMQNIIAKAGIELSEDELNQISGGYKFSDLLNISIEYVCDDCKTEFQIPFISIQSGSRTCPHCHGYKTHEVIVRR